MPSLNVNPRVGQLCVGGGCAVCWSRSPPKAARQYIASSEVSVPKGWESFSWIEFLSMRNVQEDNVNRGEVEQLVDSFPGQSIDFFGALRARVYDDMVRGFITDLGIENLGKRLVNSKEGKVTFEKPTMNVDILMKYGNLLVQEQDNVKRVQLADAYLAGAELAGAQGTSLPEEVGASASN